MGLFKRVMARAARPGAASSVARVAPHPAERVLASVPAALLPVEGERSAWKDRAGVIAGFAHRGGGPVTHVGGAEGSAARSLPRDLVGAVTVTFTDRRLVVSADPAPGAPPVEVAAFDRGDIRWVARTGRSDASGVHVRCSFADESFFDVAIADGHARTLLAAAAELAG